MHRVAVSAFVLASMAAGQTPDRVNQVGAYGPWLADKVLGDGPARLSFRTGKWKNVDEWRQAARKRAMECIAPVDLGGAPKVTVTGRTTYDGLDIEFLTWQLPMGPKTEAVLLKPSGASGRLPGILALHDHGGNKFLGWRKITQDGLHAVDRAGEPSGRVLRRGRPGRTKSPNGDTPFWFTIRFRSPAAG